VDRHAASALALGVVLAVAAGACSGGGNDGGGGASPGADAASRVDIAGWYRVTSDRGGPCGATLAPVAAVLSPPYVRVDARQDIFILRTCQGQADADCKGTRFYDFTTPITDGWSAAGGSAFFSAGCTLVWERASATLHGSELRVRSQRNEAHNDGPQSQCTLAAAEAVTACKSEAEMIATRL
jgi:hypothetical protein